MAHVEVLDSSRSVVTVIDFQGKLMDMIVRPRLVVEASIRLMKLAEIFRVPVVLTEQYPEGLGKTHPEVRAAFEALTTPKAELAKISFGCCGDPGFENAIAQVRPGVPAGQRQIVVAGIEAHICVMQTVLELLRTGHQVHLCWEAISGRGEEYRRHALDRMEQAGAQLTNHESVAFEWARDKDHEGFRAMNRLLREGQLG
ncbi:MAG: isochorismatase family protein [Acidobacteria bacterium]|nr:isochorismatase family protein [Acidobacteriota bacterium]